MEAGAVQFLFNLLGWMILGICVLFGIAKASPVGFFRALWLLAIAWFAYRIADRLAVPLAAPVGGILGLKEVGAEVAGYWAGFLSVVIFGALWHRFTSDHRIVVPPIIEQIGTPLVGAAAG